MEKHNSYELDFENRKDFNFKEVYGDNAIIIADNALQLGLSVKPLFRRYLEISNSKKNHIFQSADSTAVSRLGTLMSEDKEKSKYFLKRAGIPVPKGKLFFANEIKEIINYAKNLGNFVLKPNNGDCGERVYLELQHSSIEEIIKTGFFPNEEIIIEERIEGEEYRFFCIENGYIAIMCRNPANVLGDGINNLEKLIEEKNQDRIKRFLEKNGSPFRKIEIDNASRKSLNSRGLDLGYVPKRDERVFLRGNSNLSTGGDSISIDPEIIPPEIKEAAMASIKAIPGFPYGGVDIMIPENPSKKKKFAVLEINHIPGIKGFHYPYLGQPQNPAKNLLEYLFF